MRIEERLSDEFKLFIKNEIIKKHAGNRNEYLIETVYKLNDFEEIIDLLKNNKDLSPLTESVFIANTFNNTNNKYNLKKLGFDKSKSILKTAIYVNAEIEKFETNEYFDSELLVFYKNVFNNFTKLMETDDFVKASEILDINLSLDVWSKKEFIDLLTSAIDKYPTSYVIRERLIAVYTRTDQFQKTIKLIDETVKLMDKNNIFNKSKDDVFDFQLSKLYLDIIQIRAYINFNLKNHKNAKQDVDFVLNNLPDFPFSDLDKEADYENEEDRPPKKELDDYIEALLIRIEINLINGSKTELLADFKAIINEWVIVDIPAWKEFYPNAVKYIENEFEKKTN